MGSQDFFDKDHCGEYTNQALIYRDIMKYALIETNKFFRSWGLTGWLLNNNLEFKKSSYKSNLDRSPSSSIENRHDRVKKALRKLEEISLISTRPAEASKGNAPIKEYTLTEKGYVVALFVEVDNDPKLTESYDKLFDLMITSLRDRPSSVDSFLLIFLSKCKEAGVFKEFIDYYLDRMKSDYEYSRNRTTLEILLFFPLKDEITVKKFYELWRKSALELPEELVPTLSILFKKRTR